MNFIKFTKFADNIVGLQIWIFIGGCISLVLASILGLSEHTELIYSLTCVPALASWLLLTGIGIIWGTFLGFQRNKRKGRRIAEDFTAYLMLLLGITFTCGGVMFISFLFR